MRSSCNTDATDDSVVLVALCVVLPVPISGVQRPRHSSADEDGSVRTSPESTGYSFNERLSCSHSAVRSEDVDYSVRPGISALHSSVSGTGIVFCKRMFDDEQLIAVDKVISRRQARQK